MFLVLPNSNTVSYYSATVIPLDKDMKRFDVSIHHESFQGKKKDDLNFKNLGLDKVVKTLKFYKN